MRDHVKPCRCVHPRAAQQASNNAENERLARQNMQPEVMPPQALRDVADQLGLEIPVMNSSDDDSVDVPLECEQCRGSLHTHIVISSAAPSACQDS